MLNRVALRYLQGQQVELVMERIVGRDCHDMSAEHFMNLSANQQVECLWVKGFVHGDLAARDIMVTSNGMVRLVDGPCGACCNGYSTLSQDC
jgi:tRNA A-37 threonylcarbamoyl transferase component Bud32